MKTKLALGGCFATVLALAFFHFFPQLSPSTVKAANLSDLSFGSVIKIQPTDTYMCNDTANCTATTNNVLPFKFVKMQARQTNTSATPYGDVNGYTINGQSYTYWMLLDNYCWWGKSDCRFYDGTRHSNYASWNATGTTTGTFSNNITDTRSNNILKTLANFYDSLPADIGGIAKETAIPLFAWDMYGVSVNNPPAVGWSGGTWTNTTYDPNTNVNSRFTFTGSNTAANPPIMNSRIGLVSFHEWQGGNTSYTSNPTSNNGSGGSYCLARFGTANCTASSGQMFNDANTSAGNQNTVASATNPRPRYPWTRSPYSASSTNVWLLDGSPSISLSHVNAVNSDGVSPTLWLSSSISTIGGTGTYTEPYYINFCDNPANANKLACLPFGSVIQVTPTDTEMCNDTANCTAKTNNVLPFKFVKMQARKTDTSATALGNQDGHTINGQNYTYWMLLDNYCWWGKSDCRDYDGNRYSKYASWNANNSSDYSNNITDTKSNNILKVLANFYDSLPADIGGLSKEEAVPVFAWDMNGVSTANSPAVGWGGGTWTNTTYDPNTNVNSRFSFTGSNSAPVMNSRIGLVSFHEWQGGNMVYTSNPTSNNGAGGSYCLARFGTANCAASSGNMFDENNISAGNQNTVASATNPRPRYPWTRSPYSTYSTVVWNLHGSTSRSLNFSVAHSNFGVSPTLWFSSDLAVTCGEGSYQTPFRISSNECIPAPAVKLSAPSAVWNSSNQTLDVTGIVDYPADGRSIVIWAAACNKAGQCKQKSTTVISSSSGQAYNLTWLDSELPAGEYDGTLWVGAHVVASADNNYIQSNAVNFTIDPREMDLTVVKNRPFNLVLGDAGIFNLAPGVNQGVTITIDANNHDLSVSGTLSADVQVPFGSTTLNFKTLNIPQSTVINTSLH